VTRHRPHLLIGVDQGNLDVKNGYGLGRGRARDDEGKRREDEHAKHQSIVAALPLDVNGRASEKGSCPACP
jgi:hypothetical protein